MEGIPKLSIEMKDMPDRILSCMGLAVHQVRQWWFFYLKKLCKPEINVKCMKIEVQLCYVVVFFMKISNYVISLKKNVFVF